MSRDLPSSVPPADEVPAGLGFGVLAYASWGAMPLYFKVVKSVPPAAVLSHRIVWSVLFLTLLLAARRELGAVGRCLRDRRVVLALFGSTLMIATNWFTFIWAVSNGRVVECSFGYFLNPLVNVLLGVAVLKEKLRPAQAVSVGLAVCGAGVMTWHLGGVPLVSLALAVSFGAYGLIRKVTPVNPLVGLSVETLILLPAAATFLIANPGGDAGLTYRGAGMAGALMLGGVVTALPLIWFAAAARRLRLATLGFLQYLAPTGQLLLAVLAFGEPFTVWHAAGFGLIWLAIAVFSADAVAGFRRPVAGTAHGSSDPGV